MPVKIFCSYAHEDEELLNQFKRQLMPLQRQGLIDVWHDRDISAGTEWEHEISQQLNTAQIILLLVSPDFMYSEYCYGIEMKRALERHEREEARAIPVILRPVLWQQAPFGKLQALPTDAIPVTSSKWYNLDEAFFDVAEGILKTVNGFLISSSLRVAQKTAKQWLEEGDNHYISKCYNEALSAYEQAIYLDPKNADAYY